MMRVPVDLAAFGLVVVATVSFGAVYPWGYIPMAGVAGVIAAVSYLQRRERALPRRDPLSVALLLFIAAVGVQLVPLPVAAIVRISPKTAAFLMQYDVTFAALGAPHALSISPAATATALILFVALALLTAAAAREFSDRGASRFAGWMLVFGGSLALVAIIVKAVGASGKVYGLWTPLTKGNPFGPFVNRNHFAGWMLMAFALSAAYVVASARRDLARARPGVRERIIWLATPAGCRLLLGLAGTMVMALSIVLTMSRSGILCGAVTGAALALMLSSGSSTWRARFLVAAMPVGAVTLAAWWAGADVVASRFAQTAGSELALRRGAWETALLILRDFPVVGSGLNTYGVATLLYQPQEFPVHFREAHNDYLQLLSDGGALLAVPLIMLVTTFWMRVRSAFRDTSDGGARCLRAGAVAGIVGIGLQEVADFSLQMPANALLFSLLCAVALHRPRLRRAAGSVSAVR